MASSKIIIYQIFTRLYGNRNTTRKENGTIAENGCGKMNDFTPTTLKKIREMGVSHIWYTGVIRHATQTDYSAYGIPKNHPAVVKGKAGSPYAIADYYDIDPDIAVDVNKRMKEFEALVERTHKAGMKVIIDFVPNHVARQYHSICKPEGIKDLGECDDPLQGFSPQNNFYYCPGQRFSPYLDLYHGEVEPYHEEPAKATGNDCFHNAPSMNDWYETVKLNYGLDYYVGRVGHFKPIPDTWGKMTDILLFWAKKGVDGFRCDMAEMVPAEFWQWATDKVKFAYPDIVFIGEVYNPMEYRHYLSAGFDYLYDKVGMYDTIREVICGQQSTRAITSARKGVPGLVVSALLQQNPLMIYAGQEYGERGMDKEGFSGIDGRTTIFDYWSVDTLVRAAKRKLTKDETALKDIYNKVINIARSEKAVCEGTCFDLMYVNGQYQRQYAFLRKAGSEVLLVVVNFDDLPTTMDVTIPAHAFDYLKLKERKNVTAVDLLSGKEIKRQLYRDCYVSVDLEPLGSVVLKFKS